MSPIVAVRVRKPRHDGHKDIKLEFQTPPLEHDFDGAVIADNCEKRISSTTMLAFYVDSSACKNIPVRPETNFARPEATCDFILLGGQLYKGRKHFKLLTINKGQQNIKSVLCDQQIPTKFFIQQKILFESTS